MKAVLFRTSSGSFPVHAPPVSGSPRLSVSIPVRDCSVSCRTIRRCSSESDVDRLEVKAMSKLGSRSFPATPRIPEEEDCDVVDRRGCAGDLSEVLDFPGGGMNRKPFCGFGGGGGGFGDNFGDRCQIGSYYQELLKSDPMNPLILRNYAKYLHEVEKDAVKAEEYYGRAILASPEDGEVLSLYAKLIWETQRDENRAKFYFDQAVLASPNDCSVLGSYALFLWESDEDEIERPANEQLVHSAAVVKAF